jgi:Leucine-rich repeat (LRR) protein
LNLRKNRLSSVPVDIITYKNHIQELDIGDNNIKKVDTYLVQRYYPELRRLDVSRNRISRFFSTSPLDNSTLEVIDASFNYISKLDPSALSNISTLKQLNLSNNEIRTLSQDAFANNPELIRLDVSNNHILTIHRDAFRKNPKIREIYAGSNGMTYLHPGTFSGNPQLTKVTVSWNKIQDINPETFYNNPNLEYLDFNNNKLKALDPGTFQKNPMLKSVDLSSNSLVTIHDNTFHYNPKLEHLLLSKNEHIRLHSGLIIVASSLRVFDAQHCNLSSLPVDFFKNSTALRQLFLGNNNLTSMDCVSNKNSDGYSDTLTKLQVIDVSHNQLQTINVEVLRNQMTQLKSLRIEGNPFLCDCKLRDAWLWSQKVGIIPPQPQITCTNMQWMSVPWDDVQHLNCSDESLLEEPASTVTGSPAEESTFIRAGSPADESSSTVTSAPAEESASTGTPAEESPSTVTSTPAEDSTSAVTTTPAEESTSTIRSAHTVNTSRTSQYFSSSHESLTKESTTVRVTEEPSSTVTGTNSDLDVLQVEKHDNSTHNDKERGYNILIILILVALGLTLVMFLLVFLMRRKHGIYRVCKAARGTKSNNPTSSVPVSAAPAL